MSSATDRAQTQRRRYVWNEQAAADRACVNGDQVAATRLRRNQAALQEADRISALNVASGANISWWRVLNIPATATRDAFETAYKGLVRVLHPDKTRSLEGNDKAAADDAIRKINKAQEEARAMYQRQADETERQRQREQRAAEHRERQRRVEEERQRRIEEEKRLAEEERKRRAELRRIQEERLRSLKQNATTNLIAHMQAGPMYVNINALEVAVREGETRLVDLSLLEQARQSHAAAKAEQHRASCESAGGPNIEQVTVCGHAVRCTPTSDEYFTVGTAPCRCGRDFWAVRSSGVTGTEPFSTCSTIVPVEEPVADQDEAGRAAEREYRAHTGLTLLQATEPPSVRPNQWSSTGKLCIGMKGMEGTSEKIMWQFYRKDSADGYNPGWHNYQPCPDTGTDSVRIVETLYQQHRYWSTAGGGAPNTGTRLVRSARFSYALDFIAGASSAGMQTNSQTQVQRQVRRVPFAQACKCARCTQPPPPPKAAPQPAPPMPPMPPPMSPGQGLRPPASNQFAEQLKAMLAVGDDGLPRLWHGENAPPSQGYTLHTVVGPAERGLVTGHLLESLGKNGAPVQFHKVQRVMNPHTWRQFVHSGDITLMFHGCKTLANETSIVQNGFRIDHCKSGGSNFGTWFAYVSSYSDGSFAFNDSQGWRHLFVCCVSKRQGKKDDNIMRVVGQGCAYPMWIVTYKHGA